MGELTGLARQAFFDLFLPTFNRLHGTTYAGQPDELPHMDWDYRWASPGGRPLLVQHTRAASDEEEERAKRAIAGQWAYDEIHGPLRSTGHKGFRLTIMVRALPEKRAKREAMGAALRRTILEGMEQPLRLGETRSLAPYAQGTGIAEMELVGIDADRSEISIQGPPFHFDQHNVAARGVEAFRRKLSRLGPRPSEVVLAIFFDLTGYEDVELDEMRAAFGLETVPFREVWAVNPYQPGARTDRLWPT